MEARQHEDLRDFVDSLEEEWLREVPDLHTAGLAVVARLVRMSYYIARRVDSNLARFGLTRGEFEVLAVLTRNPDAKITPKDIHAKILITSGGLSNRIRKLEEKGLIVRMPDQSDGRGVVLKVTERGVSSRSRPSRATSKWSASWSRVSAPRTARRSRGFSRSSSSRSRAFSIRTV